MPDTKQVTPDAQKAASEVRKDELKEGLKAEKKEVVVKKKGPAKKFFKSFVDVKKWSSYDEVSSNTKTAWGLFRRLSNRNKDVRKETYEDAISRMGLSEEQIHQRKKNFLLSALVYAVFALGFFVYLVYLLINVKLLAASLTLLLVVLMSLATYREHFWYMQMHKRKLGCTFEDWLAFILRRPLK